MPNILFLSQLVPYPPDSGPKVRSYNVLRYLAQKHAVTLVALRRSDDSEEALEHLRTICKAVHTIPIERSMSRDILNLAGSLLTNDSFIIRRDRVVAMQALIDHELNRSHFDFIHADQLWMAQYALRSRKSDARPALILDEHNATFQIFQRMAGGERNPVRKLILEREWRALQRYEVETCAKFDQVVTVTENDLTILEPMVNSLDVSTTNNHFQVIPICIDTESIEVVKPVHRSQEILHMGTMFWMPNFEGVSWFIQEVWPLVKTKVSEASFTIVGKRPPGGLIRQADQDDSIQVTGYVEDPTENLENSAAFIVPLHSGSGMRVKIVESWARGLPIVSTTIGAEGLRYRDGENILIADGAEAFAAATVRVLQDTELNLRLRKNGREWAEQHYDWRKTYARWDEVYCLAAERRR